MNKRAIMIRAWEYVRSKGMSISQALRLAWRKSYEYVKCTVLRSSVTHCQLVARVKGFDGWRIRTIWVTKSLVMDGMVEDRLLAKYFGGKTYVIL